MREPMTSLIPVGSSGHFIRLLWALSLLLPLPFAHTAAAEPDMVRRQFREVDTLFANPGQGWMSQQRSPGSEPRFPCSVV